jgi:hypothetical protein
MRGPQELRMSSTICELARDFLSELSISEPPLPVGRCLEARGLSIAEESLDDLLGGVSFRLPAERRPDAMLYVPERKIWLKDGLHVRHLEWVPIHELAHDVLPWQREMLRFVCIFELPQPTQKEWELEANLFTAECRFLGQRFRDEALSMPFNLSTPWRLADRYGASYESAFRHYVEGQPRSCCLLVSRPTRTVNGLYLSGRELYEIHYYVNSSTFHGSIRPKQQFSSSELDQLVNSGVADYFLDHEVPVKSPSGLYKVYHAQSFTNTYKVFTLLSPTPLDPVQRMSPFPNLHARLVPTHSAG